MSGPIKRVMIVDSHVAVRRGIRDALAHTRFQVVAEAADGRSAITLSKSVLPDIVILDHIQPRVGAGLVDGLKAIHPSPEVLIYSAALNDKSVGDLVHSGIRACVCKSEPLDELTTALDALAVNRMHFSRSVNRAMLGRIVAGKQLPRPGLLSNSEMKVVQLIAEGRRAPEISRELGISKKTIETHRRNARFKINCRTTADIVRYAVRNRLVQA